MLSRGIESRRARPGVITPGGIVACAVLAGVVAGGGSPTRGIPVLLDAGGIVACAVLAGIVAAGCSQTRVILVLLDAGGDADAGADAVAADARPDRVTDAAPVNVIAVATGDSHACAVVLGALYCWGAND